MIPKIPFFPNTSCNATEAKGFIQHENQNVSSTSTKKTVEEPIINQQDSALPDTNGPMTLKENDQRCERKFWDFFLECYQKKDRNCFTEPGLAALYKDCD